MIHGSRAPPGPLSAIEMPLNAIPFVTGAECSSCVCQKRNPKRQAENLVLKSARPGSCGPEATPRETNAECSLGCILPQPRSPLYGSPRDTDNISLIIVFEQERSPENQPPRFLTGAECPRCTGPKPASKQEAQDLFSWEQNAPSSSCRVRQQAADAVAVVQSRSLRLLWPKARPREETQRPSVKTFRRSCASP